MKMTGISITDKFVRIAELDLSNKHINSIKLREMAYDSESFKNPDFVKDLKRIVKNDKIYKKAFVSLPNKDVIVKDKIVPPIKREEIFKLIEAEIKDYAIFEHQNVSLGFNIVEKAKDKIKIVWAGAKEETVLNTIKILKKAGIRTIGIIPSNFALGKFVSTFYENDGAFLIINIDTLETTLTFMQNKKVLYAYTYDIGIEELSRDDVLIKNNWLGNIFTTLTFVTRNRNFHLEKIFIASQSDQTDGLVEILKSRTGYPVVSAKIPDSISHLDEETYLHIQKDGGARFSEAVGLALFGEELQKDSLFCDISKHVLVEKKSMSIKISVTILLLFLINGTIFYFYPYINSTLISLQESIESTKSKITVASKAAKNTEELKTEISSLNNMISQYELIKKDLKKRTVSSSLLSEFKEKLPDGVSIQSVSISENGNISISGTGPSYRKVLDYEVNLSTAKYVDNATIHTMSKRGSNGTVSFSMTATVKGVGNEKK